jgi:peroxiredoxin
MFRYAIAALVLAFFLAPVDAGQFNKKISLGDAAPTFKLPGTDGKEYSLDSFKDKDVLVIAVTCNECPVAQDYQDRLLAFAKKYTGDKSKVGFLAVNVNPSLDEKGDSESLPKMKELAKTKGFTFPYVRDETQALGRKLGATRTPEIFVFNKERKLVYTGAVDDSQDDPKVNYLEAAVDATLKGGKVEPAETRARGCGIQYEKK